MNMNVDMYDMLHLRLRYEFRHVQLR